MENDLKNLQQELLRLTIRLIALENKPASESKADNSLFNDIRLMIDKLNIRIAVLEEAWQRQRKFNFDIMEIASSNTKAISFINKSSELRKPTRFWPF